MKNLIVIILVMSTFMLCFPLLAIRENPITASGNKNTEKEVYTSSLKEDGFFRVLISSTGEIKEISDEDYIFCVVAAEMPALYEKEALKAQAVAAYSFALRRQAEASGKDYDISTDPSVDQSYISQEDIKSKWGEKAEEYSEKIRSAVKEVKGLAVIYKNEVALTLYHAISCGATESSADIWGGKYSYLSSVDSVWDKLAENYLTTKSFTADELKNKLGKDYSFDKKTSSWIKITEKTKMGSVKKLTLCGKEISGEELRKALDLRSLNFTVNFKEDVFTFTVKGYGHGVGMSQNGANYMAKQGSDFKEILEYYYKGCTVKSVAK